MSEIIDKARYSRQLYAIGEDVSIKLKNSKILIIGYNNLTQEIIKNLALIGVKEIHLHYNTRSKDNFLNSYEKTGMYFGEPKTYNDSSKLLNDVKKLNPYIYFSIVNVLDTNNEFKMEEFKNNYNCVILLFCLYLNRTQTR